jgi:hypothetical protein
MTATTGPRTGIEGLRPWNTLDFGPAPPAAIIPRLSYAPAKRT